MNFFKKFAIATILVIINTATFTFGNNFTNDPDFEQQYHHALIQTLRAWELLEEKQTTTVRVGIIDAGICGAHQDLVNMLDENLHGISSTAPSSENPLVVGTAPNDAHGTHIAGIIGAEANNGIGGAGIAQDVSLVAFRVLGQTNAEGIVEGMRFMTENQVPVVNISIGGPADAFLDLLRPLLSRYTGLVVLSGGNGNQNYNRSVGHGFHNLITVGASNSSDNRWLEASNLGSDYCRYSMDVFAPGHNIWSTDSWGTSGLDSHNRHRHWSGTSFAAPMVAATAALMLSVNPSLTAAELRTIIMETSDNVPQLQNFTASGRLNVYAAVKAAIEAANRTEFNLSFNLFGGQYSGNQNLLSQTVARGKNATALSANPTRDGFAFMGWAPKVNLANINENRMFVAQWRQLDLTVDCSGENFRGNWVLRGGTLSGGIYPIGDIVAHSGSFWRARDLGTGLFSNGEMGSPGSAVGGSLWEEVQCYDERDDYCPQCEKSPCICATIQPVCDVCGNHPCECENGGTFIRDRQPTDNRFGIVLENAIVSDVARIGVIIPEPATVNLRIFDALGNVVWAADGVGAYCIRPTIPNERTTNNVGDLGVCNTPLQNAIVWNLTNPAGRFVANGTYLIIVEATGISGRIHRYVARIGVKR